jgi:uncharacterized protein
MKLTDDQNSRANFVRSYGPGEVRIGETAYRANCVVSADTIISNWSPTDVSAMQSQDLEPIFALNPEVIVLGTGARQQFPATALMSVALSRGIGMEVMDTGAACRTFNILIAEGRRAVAALFVN